MVDVEVINEAMILDEQFIPVSVDCDFFSIQ